MFVYKAELVGSCSCVLIKDCFSGPHRHEEWCPGYLQADTPWEASYDVQCNTKQGGPPCLPQVYAGCELTSR